MKYTQKHRKLIANFLTKAGMSKEAKVVLTHEKYKPEISDVVRDAARITKIGIATKPPLLDALRRYENRHCPIFSECPLSECEGGVWCAITNLGGSHGCIGFAYSHMGKLHKVSLKKRRKIMFEILKSKTGKDYAPTRKSH